MRSPRTIGRRSILAGLAALAGCQQSAAPQQAVLPGAEMPWLGSDGTGYIIFQATISRSTRDLFIAGVDKLVAMNATGVLVLINSGGGEISAAQDMVAFVDRTHADHNIRFTMYNSGLVASAACYVFLAGQRRLSSPRGAFLFHEASMVASGPLTSQGLQEASASVQRIERSFLTTLTTKTRLTEAEAMSFVRRTVILSADEARRDGIVEAVTVLALPPKTKIYLIRNAAPSGATAAPPRPPAPAAGG